MTAKEILEANNPIKIVTNILFLFASAWMNAHVLATIPHEFPSKIILCVLAVALELFGAFNLALAIAKKSGLLYGAYAIQVLFVLSLHLIWGLNEIGWKQHLAGGTTVAASRAEITMKQNDEIIDRLNSVLSNESLTGYGPRYSAALSNVMAFQSNSQMAISEAVTTNTTSTEAETFNLLPWMKYVIFGFLSILIQYGLFLTAWILPEKKVIPSAQVAQNTIGGQQGSLFEWIKRHEPEVEKYIEALLNIRPGLKRINSNPVIIKATGLSEEVCDICRRALQSLKYKGKSLINTTQGSSEANFPKDEIQRVMHDIATGKYD